jgi:intein/homing endonuclease
VIEVKFSNGKKLIGTKNHPIYTNNGKVLLDDLKYCDIIKVWKAPYQSP